MLCRPQEDEAAALEVEALHPPRQTRICALCRTPEQQRHTRASKRFQVLYTVCSLIVWYGDWIMSAA